MFEYQLISTNKLTRSITAEWAWEAGNSMEYKNACMQAGEVRTYYISLQMTALKTKYY
jgi:hypothetical protein